MKKTLAQILEQKSHKIYMGFDPRETEAYEVARSSIIRRSAIMASVIPLRLHELPMLTRPIERKDGRMWCPISQAPMATEFAISRFCVPFIRKEGWAAFMDCDIVCLADVGELFALADPKFAVLVVKHAHKETGAVKMDNQLQTFYARKNWSSVVLWNCAHPSNRKFVASDALNTWPGRDLHAFKWLDDSEIGELPKEWNHLVGIDSPTDAIKIAHFTLGGPFIEGWKGGPFDEVWNEERRLMTGQKLAHVDG